MSEMEDDAATFLKKIVKTLSAAVVWLLFNMTVGIYMGWMFFADYPTVGNYIYYIFFLTSLAAMIWYFLKVWKGIMKH